MKTDPGIERLRAIVRPIVVLYCTVILSVLAIMQAAGVGMPPQGVSADIVTAFIAITGTVTTEYAIERGIRHFKEKGKTAEKEVPRIAGRPSKGSPEGNPSGGGLPDVSGQLYSPPLLEERGTGGEVNKRRGLIETLSAKEWFTNLVV